MSGYVCTIAGGKGGVGRTTLAINLGTALQERGSNAVVVDADVEMADVAAMLGLNPDATLHEILAGATSLSHVPTAAPGELTVIPGEQSLSAVTDAGPERLRTVVETLRNVYDVILVDTGSGLSEYLTAPLEAADSVLLVTTPDDLAVADTATVDDVAEHLDASVVGVIVNRASDDTDADAIAERLGRPLLGVVPDDAAAAGDQPAVLNAPEAPSTDVYERLADSLSDLFLGGATADELDPVRETSRTAGTTGGPETTDEDQDQSEDDDDDDGYSHNVFQGI